MTDEKDDKPKLPKIEKEPETTGDEQSPSDSHEKSLLKTAISDEYKRIFENIHKSSVSGIMKDLFKSQERMKNLYKIPNLSSDIIQDHLKNQERIKNLYRIPTANIPDYKSLLPDWGKAFKNDNFENIAGLTDKHAKIADSFTAQESDLLKKMNNLPPPADVITNQKLDELIYANTELAKTVAVAVTVASRINERADQFVNEFKISSDEIHNKAENFITKFERASIETNKSANKAITVGWISLFVAALALIYQVISSNRADPYLIKTAEEIEKLRQIEAEGKQKEQLTIPYTFNGWQKMEPHDYLSLPLPSQYDKPGL